MKPTQSEDQYVCEHETNFRMQKLQQDQQEATPAENRFLKALHWMRCPKCGHELKKEHHGTVEIDVCLSCRGAWLDSMALESIAGSTAELVVRHARCPVLVVRDKKRSPAA